MGGLAVLACLVGESGPCVCLVAWCAGLPGGVSACACGDAVPCYAWCPASPMGGWLLCWQGGFETVLAGWGLGGALVLLGRLLPWLYMGRVGVWGGFWSSVACFGW